MRLAKAGYGGGNPEIIGKMSCEWVLNLIEYEDFCNDYEEEHYNLNNNG